SSRSRHTRSKRDWSSDVCSSDLLRPDTEEMMRTYRVMLIAMFGSLYYVGGNVHLIGKRRLIDYTAFMGKSYGEIRVVFILPFVEIGRATCRERVCGKRTDGT